MYLVKLNKNRNYYLAQITFSKAGQLTLNPNYEKFPSLKLNVYIYERILK